MRQGRGWAGAGVPQAGWALGARGVGLVQVLPGAVEASPLPVCAAWPRTSRPAEQLGWGGAPVGGLPPGQPALHGAAAQVDPGGSLLCSPEARLQVERALGPHLRWDPRLLAVSHGAGAGVLRLRRREPQETPAQIPHWADV